MSRALSGSAGLLLGAASLVAAVAAAPWASHAWQGELRRTIDERGIDASTLYYTESEAFSAAYLRMRCRPAATALRDPEARPRSVAARAAELELRLPQLLAEHHVPGASIALIADGGIAWSRGFGLRRAGRSEPVDADTVFEAASMSKPVFAYAAMQLVEQGRLDLDRPLDEYLPTAYDPGDPRAAAITARHVLAHRTGFPNWRLGGWRSGAPIPLRFAPGTRYGYSGEGFLYLQRVVEHLVEEELEPWIQARLLRPLGMSRSAFVLRGALLSNFAGGHDREGAERAERRHYDRPNAGYTLYTTALDYARFLVEQLDRDRSAPHSLRAETLAEMFRSQAPGASTEEEGAHRGLAWALQAGEQGGFVYHGGSNGTGFRSVARFHPGRREGVVVLTNAVGGEAVWKAVLELLDRP